MSDPEVPEPLLKDIYIAKEIDKSYQIGMVLSHANASSVRNNDFYSCLEIMTSRISSQVHYFPGDVKTQKSIGTNVPK